MKSGKAQRLWQLKSSIIIVYIALIVLALLAAFTNVLHAASDLAIPSFVWLLAVLVLLLGMIALLSKVFTISEYIEASDEKLEKIAETLEKNRAAVAQVINNTRLTEVAKSIAFREADRQTLREAVFDKLQQQDFDTTSEIIDEIATRPEYRELAEQLRAEANQYRHATDQERANQVIVYIERLFDSYQWAKASIQTERLIKDYPDSEQALQMRQMLTEKKQERKKILLTAWDDAVKRQSTDRSLEILSELDHYLTPNEGLALQEAARDVFRTKLHNLGVQFSIAVSGRQWDSAMQIGQNIMKGFPNSRMAEEIREKWDILKQNADQQS